MRATDVWDDRAEVVVVGLGAAGASTALRAAAAGSSVLVLEKQANQPPASHHSSSHMSGGVFLQPTDATAAFRYLRALADAGSGPTGVTWCDDDVIMAFVQASLGIKAWLESMGADLTLLGGKAEHDFPGIENFQNYRFKGSGLGMMRFLEERLATDAGIAIRYGWQVTNLLTNDDGRVVGVRCTNPDGLHANVRASRGVVLATGGFEFNESMKLNFLKCYPAYFTGSAASTGDGVRMCMEIGADIWHMNCVSGRFVLKVDDFVNAIPLRMAGARKAPSGYIVVDKSGRRFISEQFKPHSAYYDLGLYDSTNLDLPRVPSYWIFDTRRMVAGRLCEASTGITGPVKGYEWSRDNRAELDKGWIVTAQTIDDLAQRIGLDPGRLRASVGRWNKHCEDGYDSDFGRSAEHLVPLDRPPFYALQAWPGGSNTHGGARRDGSGRVLDVHGRPIPGLFAAGEFGSMFGQLYSGGGGTLSECFASGLLAGTGAADQGR